jgi:hypothetical protein
LREVAIEVGVGCAPFLDVTSTGGCDATINVLAGGERRIQRRDGDFDGRMEDVDGG